MSSDAGDHRQVANAATGEHYQVTVDQSDQFRMAWGIRAGGNVLAHVHPHADEEFEITSGRVRFRVGKGHVVCGPGDRLVVPAGTVHDIQPLGRDVVGHVEVRPAQDMRRFFEAVAGMANEGRVTKAGIPRNPLQLAVFTLGFQREFRAAVAPWFLQRAVLAPLAAIGRRRGYRPWYERWDTSGPTDSRP